MLKIIAASRPHRNIHDLSRHTRLSLMSFQNSFISNTHLSNIHDMSCWHFHETATVPNRPLSIHFQTDLFLEIMVCLTAVSSKPIQFKTYLFLTFMTCCAIFDSCVVQLSAKLILPPARFSLMSVLPCYPSFNVAHVTDVLMSQSEKLNRLIQHWNQGIRRGNIYGMLAPLTSWRWDKC